MTTLALKLSTTFNADSAARPNSVRRVLAYRWDMIGVLALMGSSVAYAGWTLLHLA